MPIISKIQKSIKLLLEILYLLLKFIFYDVLWVAFKKTLFGTPLIAFYIAYSMIIKLDKVYTTSIYVLTPLAILIAMSSLLYGRARAVEGEEHSACLLSADHILLGSIYYLMALVWAFIVTIISIMLKEDEILTFDTQTLILIYIPTWIGVVLAYLKLINGLSSIWPYLSKHQKQH